jgi:G3E family GTPase
MIDFKNHSKQVISMASIPLHIVSGFLGSGKTTFLLEILRQAPQGMAIGIIQNEFAPAHIDGAVLRESNRDFKLLELNNGSVFCVCLLGDFVSSLYSFAETYEPDVIFLEASGLSDTTSVAELFSLPPLSDKVYLAANWCVVDAVNYPKAHRMVQRVNRQVSMADALILNKADLAGDELSGLIDSLKLQNPYAPVLPATYCQVPFFEIQFPGTKRLSMIPEELDKPGVRSMVIKTSRRISRTNLDAFLWQWAPLAYRIKGFVSLDDGSSVLVQCTMGRSEIKPSAAKQGPTELIALTDEFDLREWNRAFREMCVID